MRFTRVPAKRVKSKASKKSKKSKASLKSRKSGKKTGKKSANPWNAFLQKEAKKRGITYGEAMNLKAIRTKYHAQKH